MRQQISRNIYLYDIFCTLILIHFLSKISVAVTVKNIFLRPPLSVLDAGRIGIAAQACGIAQAALELAVDYASKRTAFGVPIARLQMIQVRRVNLVIA